MPISPRMGRLSRSLRGAAYDGLRLALGVPWITGRLGGEADDGRRQTRLGAFFDRRPVLLRAVAILAFVWGVGYLTWRVGWSSEGANPVVFAMLLVTEVYGLYALAILAWFSWSRPVAERPPITRQHAVDVYVCTYDEPVEVVRGIDLVGPALIPSLPGVAALIVPLLALVELRRILRTLVLASARRQRRLVYRFEGVDAPAHTFAGSRPVLGRVVDASASGLGLVFDAPLTVGSRPVVQLRLPDATGAEHDVPVRVEVRSCRAAGDDHLIGASIVSIDPTARLRLMEWCYVVCSHERLRGHRPSSAPALPEPIVVPLDDAPAEPVRVLSREPATA